MSSVVSNQFRGAAKPMDALDIPKLADRILVSEDHLGAFLDVEARAKGFDSKGRPIMLFEPHVFYRQLTDPKQRAEAVKAGLAYAKWGAKPYPKDSYARLTAAVGINEDAALRSCSIGMSQVLVENHVSVGFSTPQDMWQAFMDEEQEHVETMVRFILVNGIDDDLRAERWATVARVYNGPQHAKHDYAGRMAAAFKKRVAQADQDFTPTPVLDRLTFSDADTIRNVQMRLHALGYPEVGKVDGVWGTKLRAGVLGFRADRGLPLSADIDQELLTALMVAPKREIAPERAEATSADLLEAGSENIAAANKGTTAGAVLSGGGVIALVSELGDNFKGKLGEFQEVLNVAQPLFDTVKAESPYLLLVLGGYIIYQQFVVKRATVEAYREGKYVGQ